MAKAVIPLALSKFDEKHLKFPALASVKLDGVPVKLEVTVREDGTPIETTLRTRSDEDAISVQTIINEWFELNIHFFEGFVGTHCVVGEVTQLKDPYADFKDTSGIVRRQVDQGKALRWNMFDYFWDAGDTAYVDRWSYFTDKTLATVNAKPVGQVVITGMDHLLEFFDRFTNAQPKAEGLIVRNYDDEYLPNKRNKGYQKMVHEPMSDLWVVGVTEALDSKTKEPKGMVGGLVISYNGKLSKVGSGKMDHKERKELWDSLLDTGTDEVGIGTAKNLPWVSLPEKRMAQIKHKKDDSYEALRQPTFQCWRPEKDEADG